MADGPNWGALVAQNRARANGVPWSDAELYAIYTLKIPADAVRHGVKTLDAYEQFKEQGALRTTIPVKYMTRAMLLEQARSLGIAMADEDAMTRADLMELIHDSTTAD